MAGTHVPAAVRKLKSDCTPTNVCVFVGGKIELLPPAWCGTYTEAIEGAPPRYFAYYPVPDKEGNEITAKQLADFIRTYPGPFVPKPPTDRLQPFDLQRKPYEYDSKLNVMKIKIDPTKLARVIVFMESTRVYVISAQSALLWMMCLSDIPLYCMTLNTLSVTHIRRHGNRYIFQIGPTHVRS
jgi:hypothetical protein